MSRKGKGRMKGREGRRYITVRGLGVWTGLGLDLKPDTHTTPLLQVIAMLRELRVTSHKETVNISEKQRYGSVNQNHTHKLCVCI